MFTTILVLACICVLSDARYDEEAGKGFPLFNFGVVAGLIWIICHLNQ